VARPHPHVREAVGRRFGSLYYFDSPFDGEPETTGRLPLSASQRLLSLPRDAQPQPRDALCRPHLGNIDEDMLLSWLSTRATPAVLGTAPPASPRFHLETFTSRPAVKIRAGCRGF
jgi:hypothetical protein